MYEIFCLMFSGIRLNESMRRFLFKSARQMVLQKERHGRVKTDEFEGEISTDFDTAGFGFIYGMKFSAAVDSIHGSTKVVFIVRTNDLKNIDPDEGFWMESLRDMDAERVPTSAANARWN